MFSAITLRTNRGSVFLYHGERFQSTLDWLKSHDFQYFAPLEFDAKDGKCGKVDFWNVVELDIPAPKANEWGSGSESGGSRRGPGRVPGEEPWSEKAGHPPSCSCGAFPTAYMHITQTCA